MSRAVRSDPSGVRSLLDRFHRLTTEDQLAAHAEISRYLSANAPEREQDPELRVRREGLKAMRRVAEHLGKEPEKLTASEYDADRTELWLRLSSRDIATAWGSWRIARDAFVSGHKRETAQQRALRESHIRHRQTHETYIDGLRLWLASNPPRVSRPSYESWARAYNANRPPDALPLAVVETICRNLGLGWTEALRVARGDVLFERAKRRRVRRRESVRRGAAHDLVERREVAKLLRVSPARASWLFDNAAFPTPVLVIGGKRHWLREDVLAYKAGRPVPRRKRNELGDCYIGSREIAALTDYSLSWVKREINNSGSWLPPPRLVLGTLAIFDRREVEAAIEARRKSTYVR